MQQRTLGSSSLKVSEVGLGCNNFGGRIDLEASRKVVHKALDVGVTLLDTADIYGDTPGGSETVLGKVLDGNRNDVVLATKFAKPMNESGTLGGGSREYIMRAVEDSLTRLRTDWIDLYQMHETDADTPIEETLGALDDLVRSGKVRYIGCSNFPAGEVERAQDTAQAQHLNAFICCQDEYSLVERAIEKALLPTIDAYGMGLLPYFPLASGMLTGKYQRDADLPENSRFDAWKGLGERYMTEANFDIVEKLEAFCGQRGHTLLELAFSWLLAHPQVGSVIAGATRPEQIEANAAAAGWKLDENELAEIDRITTGAHA